MKSHPKPERTGTSSKMMPAIRRFAREVAERFSPEKIILFGSYAYGEPNSESDVDILVVMPARNKHDQAFKIRLACEAPFPMDLIVRTPRDMRRRLEDGDLFHTHIAKHGKLLYEKGHARMDRESRRRSRSGRTNRSKQSAFSWRRLLSLPAIV